MTTNLKPDDKVIVLEDCERSYLSSYVGQEDILCSRFQYNNQYYWNLKTIPQAWNEKHLILVPEHNRSGQVINQSIVVDDYVCLSCHNTKCSTSEKSCWKCGTIIPKVV